MTQKVDISVRPAIDADIPDLVRIESICFDEPWSKEDFLSELNDDVSVLLIASVDGKTVGFIEYQDLSGQLYIGDLAVLPDYRRLGIASYLCGCVIRLADSGCADSIVLEVDISNAPAVSLYRRLGFMICSVKKNYYEHRSADLYRFRTDALNMIYKKGNNNENTCDRDLM